MQNDAINCLQQRPDTFEFCSVVRLYNALWYCGDDKLQTEFYPADFPLYRGYEVGEVIVDNHKITTICNFEALSGGFGVVPRYYFDEMIKEINFNYEDSPFRDFFQCFNQRYYELNFDSRTVFDFCTLIESEFIHVKEQRKNRCLLTHNLAALGGSQEEAIIPMRHMVQYAGLFGQKLSCPYTLGVILSDYFGFSITVDSEDLVRCALPVSTQSSLGSANSTLGSDIVVGSCTWMAFNTLLIILNIKHTPELELIQADEQLLEKIQYFAQFYFGYSIFPKIQAKVPLSCFEPISLSSDNGGNKAIQLGVNSCLVGSSVVIDNDNTVVVELKISS